MSLADCATDPFRRIHEHFLLNHRLAVLMGGVCGSWRSGQGPDQGRDHDRQRQTPQSMEKLGHTRLKSQKASPIMVASAWIALIDQDQSTPAALH